MQTDELGSIFAFGHITILVLATLTCYMIHCGQGDSIMSGAALSMVVWNMMDRFRFSGFGPF